MRIDIFKLKYFQNNKIIIDKYDEKYISLKNIDNIIIKYIHKNDLIFLVFLNLFFKEKINFIYINFDFLKKESEISEYYRNFIDIFSKKKI